MTLKVHEKLLLTGAAGGLLYPCDAQWAGFYDRMFTHEDDETARRFQIASDFGERADG